MTREEALKKMQEFIDFFPAAKQEIEDSISALSKPIWISVKDSLPYQHEELVCSVMKSSDGTVYGLTKQVVVLGKAKTLNIALMINKVYGWEWDRLYPDIEYWMPIPPLSQEKK